MRVVFLFGWLLWSAIAAGADEFCPGYKKLDGYRPLAERKLHLLNPALLPHMKFSEGDLDHIFFTSDQHFGHDKILALSERPFSSTTEMDEKLIRNWNEKVPPHAIVFVVGDFSMNLERAEKILPRLSGQKILIAGNHDVTHPANRKARTAEEVLRFRQAYQNAGFEQVEMGMKIEIPGVPEFLVSHYPYLEKGEPLLNAQSGLPYRLEHQKTALVCGHVHCQWTQKGKMINVGVDVRKFAPVSAIDLQTELKLLVPPKKK